jgi:hypothetical protein
MKMKTTPLRILLIVLVLFAANGCSDDNGMGPSRIGGVVVAVGAFEDQEDGSQFRAQFRITFESIEAFREETRNGVINRMITTGPADVSVTGRNEWLDAAAALDSTQLRLNYAKGPDGTCRFAAAMNAQTGTGDRFSIGFTARYRMTTWIGQPPALDDFPAATGRMQVAAIRGDERRAFICQNLLVSVKGLRPLIEGFEE